MVNVDACGDRALSGTRVEIWILLKVCIVLMNYCNFHFQARQRRQITIIQLTRQPMRQMKIQLTSQLKIQLIQQLKSQLIQQQGRQLLAYIIKQINHKNHHTTMVMMMMMMMSQITQRMDCYFNLTKDTSS